MADQTHSSDTSSTRPLAGLAGRWSDDERGTSMITAAMTLPLFVVILIGFFYMFVFVFVKWQLHQGTQEAAQYISEYSRYWRVGESEIQTDHPYLGPSVDYTETEQYLPENFYAQEAARIIQSRLRDTRFYTPDLISKTLWVTVTEPAIAGSSRSDTPILEGYYEEGVPAEGAKRYCWPGADQPGDYRPIENVRFLVRSSFKIPWYARLPYVQKAYSVTVHSRAIGHMQCPRWLGQRESGDFDKSFWMGREGPYLKFRSLATVGFPTVTTVPTSTPVPPTATTGP